jgi:polar amino acid transport system substrate-binding protein
MSRHRAKVVLTLSLAMATAAGCASVSNDAAETAFDALPTTSIATTTTTVPTTSTTTTDPPPCGPADPENRTKSFRPVDVLTVGPMPAGSSMAAIAASGALEAGVDENTLPLSFRNPRSGAFEGFEIALLEEIAQAIIAEPEGTGVEILKPIPVITDEKTKVVEDGVVDLTASAVSITCERWKQVLFTIPYYEASQKVMVRTDRLQRPVLSDGTRLEQADSVSDLDRQLDGRRVCATAGSTSVGVIEQQLPNSTVLPVRTRTDCLVALQEGTADAILLHDTFLLGFKKQDPNTMILEPSLGTTHYGIAVAYGHEDLVRFLNRLLLDMREDGRLEQLYDEHFTGLGAPEDMPPLPAPEWID